jgi:hypothetical protein
MSASTRTAAHPWASAHRALLVLATLLAVSAAVAVTVIVLVTRSGTASPSAPAPAAPLEQVSDACPGTPPGQPC